MKGCEHEKKSFKIRMPCEAKTKAFSRSCENCINNKTPTCEECHHWSGFKRELQRM